MSNDAAARIAAMMAPGAKYEVAPASINGIDYRIFPNIPENMRGLYEEGLAHADETFLVGSLFRDDGVADEHGLYLGQDRFHD